MIIIVAAADPHQPIAVTIRSIRMRKVWICLSCGQLVSSCCCLLCCLGLRLLYFVSFFLRLYFSRAASIKNPTFDIFSSHAHNTHHHHHLSQRNIIAVIPCCWLLTLIYLHTDFLVPTITAFLFPLHHEDDLSYFSVLACIDGFSAFSVASGRRHQMQRFEKPNYYVYVGRW